MRINHVVQPMQLDWIHERIDENDERHDRQRRLIRRRALQAAIRTKTRDRQSESSYSRPSQELQPWVARLSSLERICPSSTADHSRSCIPKPWFSQRASERLVGILRAPTFLQDVSRILQSRSPVYDESSHHFVLLSFADTSYLQGISDFYGRSACLDAAIDCLTARIINFLAGPVSPISTLGLYVKALRLLRKSIDTTSFHERFEMYYTVPLLVLFELLTPSDRLLYLTHAEGAVKLLHFIGLQGMTSELNKTLLAMQSDITVVENLRNGRNHCCASREWKTILQQTIQFDRLPGNLRSEANVTLNSIATALPELFTCVENTVRTLHPQEITPLRDRLEKIGSLLRSWQLRWEPRLRDEPDDPEHGHNQRVLLATFNMYTAISSRLLCTMPGQPQSRLSLENEAMRNAGHAVGIISKAESCGVVDKARLAVVRTFVLSVIDTSTDWKVEIMQSSQEHCCISSSFTVWAARMGRLSCFTD